MRIDYFSVRLDQDASGQMLFAGSGPEREETELIPTLFGPGDRVLVAGNCMGWTSAWLVVNGASIVALEPNPYMARLVEDHLLIDGKPMPVMCAAVGARDGEAFLHQEGLVYECSVSTKPSDVPVAIRGLAGLIEEFRLNAVCLDIEGGEADLLQNTTAADWVGINKVLIEIHVNLIGGAGAKAVHDAILRLGFVEIESRVTYTMTEYMGNIPTNEVRLWNKVYRRSPQ